jgi:uncharacterized membrane protein
MEQQIITPIGEKNSQNPVPTEEQVRLTHIIYAMQAICFVLGVTYLIAIIALIINYVKMPDIENTWLKSHFTWQIRTFWFGLLWLIIGALTAILLVGWVILAANYIWLIYRVVKGWIYLNDNKAIS